MTRIIWDVIRDKVTRKGHFGRQGSSLAGEGGRGRVKFVFFPPAFVFLWQVNRMMRGNRAHLFFYFFFFCSNVLDVSWAAIRLANGPKLCSGSLFHRPGWPP
jgi:hypothetical protein